MRHHTTPHHRAVSWVSLAIVGAALATAAPAAGRTRTVSMGPEPSARLRLAMVEGQVNAFFPSRLVGHVGDVVRFVPRGPHTVDLPRPHSGPLAIVVPGAAKASSRDGEGRLFWFRGFDLFKVNPDLSRSAFGKTVEYDGSRRVVSGFPGGSTKPFTVTFTKAGTYTVYCNIHDGMKMTVRMLPVAAGVPTLAQDRQRAARQAREDLAAAKRLASARARPGVIDVGRAGTGGVERYAFFPSKLRVRRGATLTFRVSGASRDAHTVTTGPGSARDTTSYLGRLASSFASEVADPIASYPSDPPTVGVVSLTSRLHGNGFWNSGVMKPSPTSHVPAESQLRFPQVGTFRFFCLLHPGMQTSVTVR